MTTAELVKIADEISEILNTEDWGVELASEVVYCPRFDKESLKDLRANVLPVEEVGVRGSRGAFDYDYTIQIAIAKRVDSTERSDVDPLTGLVQEVADFWRNKRLTTTRVTENGVSLILYDHDLLRQENEFLSLITLKLKGVRSV